MFESVTGEEPRSLSVAEKLEAIFEHQRLRRFRLIDWTILMPLSLGIALGVFLTTDLPDWLGVPAGILLYGVLYVLALWIYDQRYPPATDRDFLDYLGLVGEHAKHSIGPLIVALVGVLFSL